MGPLPATYKASLAAALLVLAASALLSTSLLFRQQIQGTTDLASQIAPNLGPWMQVQEAPATAGEIRGLETRDVIKRTYSDGRHHVELVVAYIAHSSRKSAHAQEACLRGSGALVGKVESRALQRSPVRAKAISMDYNNTRQEVLYWYKIGREYTADYLSSSLKMFMGGLFGSDHQGAALVRLLTPAGKDESDAAVASRLEDFTVHLLPELEKRLP